MLWLQCKQYTSTGTVLVKNRFHAQQIWKENFLFKKPIDEAHKEPDKRHNSTVRLLQCELGLANLNPL